MSIEAIAARFADRAKTMSAADSWHRWCDELMRAIGADFAEALFMDIVGQKRLADAKIKILVEQTGCDLAQWCHEQLNIWGVTDVAFRSMLGLTAIDSYMDRVRTLTACGAGGAA